MQIQRHTMFSLTKPRFVLFHVQPGFAAVRMFLCFYGLSKRGKLLYILRKSYKSKCHLRICPATPRYGPETVPIRRYGIGGGENTQETKHARDEFDCVISLNERCQGLRLTTAQSSFTESRHKTQLTKLGILSYMYSSNLCFASVSMVLGS